MCYHNDRVSEYMYTYIYSYAIILQILRVIVFDFEHMYHCFSLLHTHSVCTYVSYIICRVSLGWGEDSCVCASRCVVWHYELEAWRYSHTVTCTNRNRDRDRDAVADTDTRMHTQHTLVHANMHIHTRARTNIRIHKYVYVNI